MAYLYKAEMLHVYALAPFPSWIFFFNLFFSHSIYPDILLLINCTCYILYFAHQLYALSVYLCAHLI